MERLVSAAILTISLASLGACKGNPGSNLGPPPALQAVSFDGTGAAGLNKAPAREAHAVDLAVLGSTLHAAWHEYNGTAQQIRVASYGGDDAAPAWTFVDGDGVNGINADATRAGVAPRLAVVGNKLYAAWLETTGVHDQVRVAVYNGNAAAPAWTFVEGAAHTLNADAAADASDPQLAVVGSKLYAIWAEPDADAIFQVRAAVYNGNDASPAWRRVDGAGVRADGTQHVLPRAAVLDHKLYVLWVEQGLQQEVLRAAVYNGMDAMPVWTAVGDGGLARSATGSAGFPSLGVVDGRLYAAWTETRTDADPMVHVSVYDRDHGTPRWIAIDGDASSALKQHDGFATDTAVGAFGRFPCVAWVEAGVDEPTRLRVAVYDGATWSWVANSGATALNRDVGPDAQAGLPRLGAFGGRLMLGWNEDNGEADQIRVSALKP